MFKDKNHPEKSEAKGFDRWRSTAKLCEYLGISWDTVLSWIKNKDMPAYKIGRFWKFKFEEIDAWVQADGSKEE